MVIGGSGIRCIQPDHKHQWAERIYRYGTDATDTDQFVGTTARKLQSIASVSTDTTTGYLLR